MLHRYRFAALILLAFPNAAKAQSAFDCSKTLVPQRDRFDATLFDKLLYAHIVKNSSSSETENAVAMDAVVDELPIGLSSQDRSKYVKSYMEYTKSDYQRYIDNHYEASYLTPVNAQIYQACVSGSSAKGGSVLTVTRIDDDTVRVDVSYRWVKPNDKPVTFTITNTSGTPVGAAGIVGTVFSPSSNDDVFSPTYKSTKAAQFSIDFNLIKPGEALKKVQLVLPANPTYRVRIFEFSRSNVTPNVQYNTNTEDGPCSAQFNFPAGPQPIGASNYFIVPGSVSDAKDFTDNGDHSYGYTIEDRKVDSSSISGKLCIHYYKPANGGSYRVEMKWRDQYPVLLRDGIPLGDLPAEVATKFGLPSSAMDVQKININAVQSLLQK